MRQINLITSTFEHNVLEKEFLSFLEPNAPNKSQCIYLSCRTALEIMVWKNPLVWPLSREATEESSHCPHSMKNAAN